MRTPLNCKICYNRLNNYRHLYLKSNPLSRKLIKNYQGNMFNKLNKPEVAEMGGLGVVMGVVGALLLVDGLRRDGQPGLAPGPGRCPRGRVRVPRLPWPAASHGESADAGS